MLFLVTGRVLNDDELDSLDKCLGKNCKFPDLEYGMAGNIPQGYCDLHIDDKKTFKKRVNGFRKKHPDLGITIINRRRSQNVLDILINVSTLIGAIIGLILGAFAIYQWFL